MVILMALASLLGTSGADAQTFANKGFLFDPGGAPSQHSLPYFVGVDTVDIGSGDFQYVVGIWDANGGYVTGQALGPWNPNKNVGNPAFTTGSAVSFNGSVYVFAPYFSNAQAWSGPFGNFTTLTFDPGTWQRTGWNDLAYLYTAEQQYVQKPGIGAAVANGTIYVFLSGSIDRTPVVFTSSDGLNWSRLSPKNAPINYSTVHDAINFTDPADGKTKIMVVVSELASNYYPLVPAVTIYDPATETWGPVDPLPQGALPDGTFGMHASAYFGSWRTTLTNSGWTSCGNYTWNSGNTNAYLHVLGAVWTGSMDYLVHWYLDPSTGTWVVDPSGCANEGQMVWWPAPCPGLTNRTPVALAPAYENYPLTGCAADDDCIRQWTWGLSCGFQVMGSNLPSWTNASDLWVPTSVWKGKGTQQPGPWTFDTIDTTNPADPAFRGDPNIYQAMAGMIRINGIVMGPPPFPADPSWQGMADWQETSNVQLGDSSGTSSATTSTFDSSITAGVEGTFTVPGVQAKTGASFTFGYASTHSTETSFTSTYEWTLGTIDQTQNTLGKLGWMVGHAPMISPQSYLATSVTDPGPTGTYMGYTQTMLNISSAESMVWPYSLTNPSDTSYPMGFLLAGVEPMPASTDVDDWSVYQGGSMQDWSDTTSGDWSVLGGKGTIPQFNMGSLQTQQYVQSETKGKDWSSTYSGTSSTSLRLGTKGNNVTASLDLSFGYETDGSSSTTVQKNMETSYLVPIFQGGYSEVQVQPYLLQALTYNAPWVPKGYQGPLPWAITYDVTYAAKSSPMLGAPDIVYAKSPPPKAAAGRITGYGPPNEPEDKPASEVDLDLRVDKVRDDFYSITKGRLSYIGPGDAVTPVEMTADEFDPERGVTVTLNGYKLYANTRKGKWTRSSNTWQYNSTRGLEKLKLTLNFRAMTWAMSVSRIELGDWFAELPNTASVTLDLNGQYILNTRISHRTAYQWQADLTSLDQPIWVQRIKVNQDLAGNGTVKLNGRLTEAMISVGDTSLVLNGDAKHYPLTSNVKNFAKKVEEKGILAYRDDNSTLRVNLGNGVWSCEADTDVFTHPLPFHHGDAELELRVGGKAYFNASIHPDSYVLILRHNGE